jgi:hypothetical protein
LLPCMYSGLSSTCQFMIVAEHFCSELCPTFKTHFKVSALFAFVNAGLATPSHIPIKGLSPLLKLHYVDFNRLWVVPFCHAFYLGVFKDSLDAIFAKRASDGTQVNDHVGRRMHCQQPGAHISIVLDTAEA